jgi:hypothetical protein
VKVYAIVDLKGRNVVNVFQSVSDETAERSFLKLITDGMPIVSDFPEDFAIFPVGELTVQNAALKVSEMGNENLAAAGFNVGTYTVTEAVKRGSDYDRRYLRMVAEDRGKIPSFGSSDAEEVKDNG